MPFMVTKGFLLGRMNGLIRCLWSSKWSKSALNCTVLRLPAACFTQLWFLGNFPVPGLSVLSHPIVWGERTPRAGSWQHLHRDSGAALQFYVDNLFWWLVELSNLWWLPCLVFDISNHVIISFFWCMNRNFYAIYPNLSWHRLASVFAIVE